jgi:hypothetical protein
MDTKYWSENVKGKNHLEDLGVEGEIGGRVWTGFIWLRIGASDGLL